ncbi:hypothetical protein KY290_001387 [Solanum tuberosum]|uniref:Uncharacterized protein n=1 Tax=Solanum tuberosum TaxID=4113 RepID=A0ABQ7WM66_SOLTU|nr:hypothetical protein KY290_001387 [Solanum tuberosum]
MDPPWVTKGRGRGSHTRGRGRSSSKSSGSSYESSSSSPIIQRGGMSLVKLTSPSKEAASSIHLDDIPENNPLYAQLQVYLSLKQSDTFALVGKEEVDDIKSYEKISKKEMIFLLENFDIQRKEEPWKIFQRYLDSSVRHIARKISIQDGNKENMINYYLDEVRKNILLNITQYEKSDTSMRSETSDDVADIQEAQLCEPTTEDVLEKAEDLLHKLKGNDHV